jgi:N-hydroxyarylamine O-acetyltransferase
MSPGPDLDLYFERIGYAGSREPVLTTLNGIVAAHTHRIPFENLDVLLGRPISLDPVAVEQKLVRARRGGYCFEQNGLLLRVLTCLGYRVTPLSARVRLQRQRDFTPARTHLFLRVELGGKSWLVDVGVGALSLTSAIELTPDRHQDTPHEPRRILREGDWSGLELRAPEARLFHQAYFANAWHDVYEFTLEPMPEIDRELGNWYTSQHPQSVFRERLMAARATSDGRVSLLNRELTLRRHDGTSESRIVGSPEALLDVLAEHFELRFPRGTQFTCPGLDFGPAPRRADS